MGAGQMFQVFSGTYNESPSISAGTAGNYKNLIINSGDIVTITGTVTMASERYATKGPFSGDPSSPKSAVTREDQSELVDSSVP
jgi:hypothetical protein